VRSNRASPFHTSQRQTLPLKQKKEKKRKEKKRNTLGSCPTNLDTPLSYTGTTLSTSPTFGAALERAQAKVTAKINYCAIPNSKLAPSSHLSFLFLSYITFKSYAQNHTHKSYAQNHTHKLYVPTNIDE
jgi:hypothetical protein